MTLEHKIVEIKTPRKKVVKRSFSLTLFYKEYGDSSFSYLVIVVLFLPMLIREIEVNFYLFYFVTDL